MSLLLRPWDDPPETIRRTRGSFEIYGHSDTWHLQKLPPEWTLRGYMERNDFPLMATAYDAGKFDIEWGQLHRDEYLAETWRMNVPLAPHVIGRLMVYDDCKFVLYISVLPDMRRQGIFTNWLTTLTRKKTVIFPEVLPDGPMMKILLNFGFYPWHIADTEDELEIYYPCWVRKGKDDRRFV